MKYAIIILLCGVLYAQEKTAPKPEAQKISELDVLNLEKTQLLSINQQYEFNDLKRRMEDLQKENAKTTSEVKAIYTEIFRKAGVDIKKFGLNVKERKFEALPETAADPKQPVPVAQNK